MAIEVSLCGCDQRCWRSLVLVGSDSPAELSHIHLSIVLCPLGSFWFDYFSLGCFSSWWWVHFLNRLVSDSVFPFLVQFELFSLPWAQAQLLCRLVGVFLARCVTLRLAFLTLLGTARRLLRTWRRFRRLRLLSLTGIFPLWIPSFYLLLLHLTSAKCGPPQPSSVLWCSHSLIFPLITFVVFDDLLSRISEILFFSFDLFDFDPCATKGQIGQCCSPKYQSSDECLSQH